MSPELLNALWPDLPLTALLAVILVGGFKGWWIFGSVHREQLEALKQDRDEWKKLALDVTGLADAAVRKLEKQ